MGNYNKIFGFLTLNKTNAYCDDCISKMCNVLPRQQVNQICNKNTNTMTKCIGVCSNCGKSKITRST
jgi:hypothetical protein